MSYTSSSKEKEAIISTELTTSNVIETGENSIKDKTTPSSGYTFEPMSLDSETESFLYGTWQVEKLLCFGNSYNDASEFPTGQKVIGDEIIIEKDLFSSQGLKNYDVYQDLTRDPRYEINLICYDSDSFYRIFKINLPDIDTNDEIKCVCVYLSATDSGFPIPVSFFIVNNDRLLMLLDATCFELKKVVD